MGKAVFLTLILQPLHIPRVRFRSVLLAHSSLRLCWPTSGVCQSANCLHWSYLPVSGCSNLYLLTIIPVLPPFPGCGSLVICIVCAMPVSGMLWGAPPTAPKKLQHVLEQYL